MKKLGLTLLLLISIVYLLPSQELYIGPRIGMNIGWFGGGAWRDYIEDSQDTYGIAVAPLPNLGAVAGIGIENMLSKSVGLGAELFYTRYGHYYEYSHTNPDVKGGSWFDVLQLPAFLKIFFPTREGYYIYGFLGPSALMVFGDLENDESDGGVSLAPGGSLDKQLLVGALGGIGFEFFMKRGTLLLEFRLTRSQELEAEDADVQFASNGFQMILGYGYRLK